LESTTFDVYKFYDTFTAGAMNLLGYQNELNKINVFPVPDGDTGTNLASTMRSILEMSRRHQSISEVAQSIADAALIGARGNSGAIFAQYFHGIRDYIGEKKEIHVTELINAFVYAVDFAYKAVLEPVEGTVLTVIKIWASVLKESFEELKAFVESFLKAFRRSTEALDQTTNQLKVLKESHVVDAGGKGFLIFLDGMGTFLKTGEKPDLTHIVDTVDTVAMSAEHHLDSEIKNRYCTEALIDSEKIDSQSLREMASGYGDSVVIADNGKKARIHVHTNNPADLFFELQKRGDIIQQKVDDMKMQYRIKNQRKYKIGLLTDSTCDIPEELLDKFQIQMVPLQLNFGSTGFLDKLTITPEYFYTLLAESPYVPSSSQPSFRKFQNLYSFLMSHYDKLIAIHLSSKLSGTYSLSQSAAEKFLLKDKEIAVIDSKMNTGALGIVVEEAAEAIDKGLSYDDVRDKINEAIEKTTLMVSLKSLKEMVRGGRVSPLKGFLGKMMNLKPVVSLDKEGKSTLYGKGFSERGNRKVIFQMFKEMHEEQGIKRYTITHANNRRDAERFEEIAKTISGKSADYIYNLSPVIGAHAGIGAVSIAFMTH